MVHSSYLHHLLQEAAPDHPGFPLSAPNPQDAPLSTRVSNCARVPRRDPPQAGQSLGPKLLGVPTPTQGLAPRDASPQLADSGAK